MVFLSVFMGVENIKLLNIKNINKNFINIIIMIIMILSMYDLYNKNELIENQKNIISKIEEEINSNSDDSILTRVINHNELENINEDYVGWIVIDDTIIDYPIVKSTNNEYYLNHDFQNNDSALGSIYLDYRNDGFIYDNQAVIYGHAANYKAMLGEINKYTDEEFYRKHPTIKIYTKDINRIYEIFSVRIVDADIVTLTVPANHIDINDLVDQYKTDSIYPIDLDVKNAINILTLVTCNYDKYENGRIIIHALTRGIK